MDLSALSERFFRLTKRSQRRHFLMDYWDEERFARWNQLPPEGYRETVIPLRLSPDELNTVLIFKPDEIGDAIYSLPAIAELHHALPHARLFLLCSELTRPLFERTGLVDEISAVKSRIFLKQFRRIDVSDALRSFSRSDFDASIFLRTYPAFFKSFLKIPAIRQIHPRDPRLRSRSLYRPQVSTWGEQRRHQALQLLELISPFTDKTYSMSDVRFPKFHWTEEDKKISPELPEPYFVIHPFSKDETRRYPMEYWKEIVQLLQRRYPIPVAVIGEKSDGSVSFENVVQYQGRLTLGQTGYLISHAKIFIGNESGPAHWAAALGVPTVTFFGGHSLPGEWAPLGRSLLIRTEVPCSPCYQRTCPEYQVACLSELRPHQIWPSLETFVTEVN